MKLAILTRHHEPFSLRIYRENIVRELIILGIEVLPFTEDGSIPERCDLVWEPGLAGNHLPRPIFKKIQIPFVATVHGAAPFSMNWKDIYPTPFNALRGKLQNYQTLAAWHWFRSKLSAVISVSEYGAQEISLVFGLQRSLIFPIYHGVEHNIFQVNDKRPTDAHPHLLQVAQYQTKKNVKRVFSAYSKLPKQNCPELIVVLPGYRGKTVEIKGIKLIREGLSHIELAALYRGALGFIFPSLHETFGMPILEAMACGCPVITSNSTACAEIAGDAALLVSPRSVDEIAHAIGRLIEDESLRESLRQKGLARSQQFTWRKSAEGHLKVFKKALGEKT